VDLVVGGGDHRDTAFTAQAVRDVLALCRSSQFLLRERGQHGTGLVDGPGGQHHNPFTTRGRGFCLCVREPRAAVTRQQDACRDEVDRFVELRLRRQNALKHRAGLPPLELRAIIHESCLTQFVGSPRIMRDQLDALLTAPSKLPMVDLRVLSARAEPHLMNTCTWSYFVFPELDRDVVQLETHAGYRHIETDDAIKRYDRAFSDITDRSLDREESAKMIHSVLQHW
jgi:hypothetical protein